MKCWQTNFFISCLLDHGVPTSIDFNGCDPAHMVASYNTGDVVVYDLETSQPVLVFSAQGESSTSFTFVLKIKVHLWKCDIMFQYSSEIKLRGCEN